MQYKDITILCLWNPWNGGYQCFDVFNREIVSALNQMQVRCLTARTVEEAVKIYNSEKIDFSFCIGQYCFFFQGIPLYDYFHVMNYEWVIDNPFKYNENTASPYHRLVMIDEEFRLMPGFGREDYLTLSLGIPEYQFQGTQERIPAVLVPWKIKRISVLEQNIEKSRLRNQLFDFIEKYDYDTSYIRFLISYFQNHDINEQIEFFMLSNDYIRLKKRLKMLSSIKRYPIVIAADEPVEGISSSNISYLPKGNFLTTLELQKQYRYVLNNNPNYDICLHDRVGHAVSNGAVVVSDKNSLMRQLNFPMAVSYNDFENLDDMLFEADAIAPQIAAEQNFKTKDFRMICVMKKMIQHHFFWESKKEAVKKS